MKHFTSMRVAAASLAAAGCLVAPLRASEPVPRIPVRVGLTIVTAISDPQGDYESIKRILSEDAGVLRLKYSSERPVPKDPLDIDWSHVTTADGKPLRPTAVGTQHQDGGNQLVATTAYRNVLQQDLVSSHVYLQQFASAPAIPETFPGATAVGTSAAVLEELKTTGQSDLTVYQPPLPDAPLKADREPGEMDFRLSGALTRVEPGPVPVPVIVNGKLVNLPAIHARGLLTIEESEFYFLDDPQNPLTLRFKIGNDSLTVVKINFPGSVELTSSPADPSSGGRGAQSGERIEQSLIDSGRAVVYGIYFSFASDRIREESEPVLRDIADTLGRHPAWKLDLEGHTDSIGSADYNQDLSNRRASSVKRALVERYHIAPGRLSPAGFGASRPKATNDTLEGRALNRRVELVKR